jgi:hypothetical protein
MSFDINLFVVLIASISIAVLSQHSDNDCKAGSEPAQGCFQYISSDCKNATFIADRLSYGNNCSNISLFWGGPVNNMTILFEIHSLDPYELCISRVGCAKAFRTTDDGLEVPVEWNPSNDDPVCFPVPHGGIPIMKFRFDAGDKWHCYGTFINFFYKL